MSKASYNECFICSAPLADEPQNIEHVVPKCLFPPGAKKNLIQLPAHVKCNSSFSLDDEYFRFCMTARAAPYEGSAKKLWDGPVMRGFHRPERPGLKKSVLDKLLPIDAHSDSGIYLGTAEAMFQDANRILRVVNRIARGIYASRTGKILPSDWPVQSAMIDFIAAKEIIDHMRMRLVPLGEQVFHYSWKHLEGDNREGLLWLVFYGGVHFFSCIGTRLRPLIGKPRPSQAQGMPHREEV